MPAETIDYDTKPLDELVQIAIERAVPNVESYRRSELRRYLRALDDGDDATMTEVSRVAADRTQKQSARSDDVMARAKANAGKPIALKPSADRALEKAGSRKGDDAQMLVVDDVVQKPREPLVAKGSSGDDILARIRARFAGSKEAQEAAKRPPPKRSLAALAVEQAQQAFGGKPAQVSADVPHFEVIESTRYFAAHGTFHLAAGSIVSQLTHDMESIRANGTKLRQIDPTKTTIRYSELGHPVAMQTVASEPQAKVAS